MSGGGEVAGTYGHRGPPIERRCRRGRPAQMTGDNQPETVLVVDDEPAYVEAYAAWLADAYEVRTATSGQAALSAVDDAIDIVLLDRRMPDISGDEVLATLRERGFDGPVAMITAVEPEVDIVDMAFNEYVIKPVTKRDLIETVETLLVRRSFDDDIEECFSLVAKRTALEASMDPPTLESTPEYRRLQSRIDALQRRATDHLNSLIERGKVDRAYADIDL